MLKKSVIVGLVLLLFGGAALCWMFLQERREKQETDSYRASRDDKADAILKQYGEWSRLAPEERPLQLFAEDINEGAEALRKGDFADNAGPVVGQSKGRELAITASGVSMVTGGTIVSGSILLLAARGVGRASRGLKKFSPTVLRGSGKSKGGQGDRGQSGECHGVSIQNHRGGAEPLYKKPEVADSARKTAAVGKLKTGEDGGWHSAKAKPSETLSPKVSSAGGETLRENTKAKDSDVNEKPRCGLAKSVCEGEVKSRGSKQVPSNSGRVNRKEGASLRPKVESVQLAAVEQPKPLEKGLSELTEQVSAIREYATLQQGRMEKLQDGYDWNIIRTFCLRIIRCIDNIDSRIDGLQVQKVKTPNLEEIRDELVFALESSGVEQFSPALKSDYRGQERKAEAVKDKQATEDEQLSGKIATIVRPGYHYVIDEGDFKVVRVAHVKLYE